jgi:hypothetical protein
MPASIPSGFMSEQTQLPIPNEGIDLELMGEQPNIINGTQFTDLEDGGVEVDFAPQMKAPFSTPFEANLAEEIPASILSTLCEDLMQAIEDDKGTRSEWEQILKKGMEFLGLKYEERTFPFPESCGVYDPTMLQSGITWQATSNSEILPDKGPIDIHIWGEETDEKLDNASRLKEYLNNYFRVVAKEFYPNTDQMLMWLPFVGMMFKKTYQDPIKLRPVSYYIQPDNLVVSDINTNDLSSCPRITHVIPKMSQKHMRQLQLKGVYLDVDVLPDDDHSQDESVITQQVNTIQGTDQRSYERDKNYTIFEVHTDIDLKGYEHEDGFGKQTKLPLPYIVTIVKESRKIIAIRRNWEENDPLAEKINYFTAYRFMQGFGFYGFGYAHLQGGSAKAATSILRQTIDAGTFANFPGGVMQKGLKPEANNIPIAPGEWRVMDTGGVPIKDALMNLPYLGPSPALIDLRREIVGGLEKIGSLTNIGFNEAQPNIAVGTVMALLENSMKVPNSIMKRVYSALCEEFALFSKLFAKYLPDQPYNFKTQGSENFVTRADFNDDMEIVSVADPTTSSSAQRLMRSLALKELGTAAPQLHNQRNLYEQIYKEMGIKDIDKILLPAPEEAKPLDPVTENQNAIVNKPFMAFIEQDHGAHVIVHQSEPDIANLPAMQAHIQEHLAMAYRLKMQQQMGIELPDPSQELPPEMQNQIAMLAAQAMQNMQQQEQEQAPPPPLDPSLVLLEEVKVKDKEVDTRFKEAEMRAETEAFKAQLKYESDQAKREIDEKIAQLKSQTEIAVTKIKALTELQKQDEKTASEDIRSEEDELSAVEKEIREADMIE